MGKMKKIKSFIKLNYLSSTARIHTLLGIGFVPFTSILRYSLPFTTEWPMWLWQYRLLPNCQFSATIRLRATIEYYNWWYNMHQFVLVVPRKKYSMVIWPHLSSPRLAKCPTQLHLIFIIWFPTPSIN